MAKRAALLRWTGRGSMSDLKASVEHVLLDRRTRAKVTAVGATLVLEGNDPVGLCLAFQNLPGVAWAAAGYVGAGTEEVAVASMLLAGNYLRRGTRFSLDAETDRGGAASDLAGIVMGAMLEKVKGARVSVRLPEVRFRAAMDGRKGSVGVEVAKGPGGVPTGSDVATCLVSGGAHSSVLAWDALLSGFRVKMVHAKSGEESMRAVARLYAELSHRVDPLATSLLVLEGGTPSAMLKAWLREEKRQVFAGFRAGVDVPGPLGRTSSPLYMLPEETFASQFEALKLKPFIGKTDWKGAGAGALTTRAFAGKRADVSGVLDGLA